MGYVPISNVLKSHYTVEVERWRSADECWEAEDVIEHVVARGAPAAFDLVCRERGLVPTPQGNGEFRMRVIGPTNGSNPTVRMEAEATATGAWS